MLEGTRSTTIVVKTAEDDMFVYAKCVFSCNQNLIIATLFSTLVNSEVNKSSNVKLERSVGISRCTGR